MLLAQGVAIDIPTGIRLIDSRADIARKDEILPQIRSAISSASIKAAVELFAHYEPRFDKLPQHFLKDIERFNALVSEDIRTDVVTLANNQDIDWEKYIQDDTKALQLMMSIPTLEIDGEKLSLYQGLQKGKEDTVFREKLPISLQGALNEHIEVEKWATKEDEERFAKEGFVKVDDFSSERLPNELDTYKAWHAMYNTLLAPVVEKTGKQVSHTFYAKPDLSKAHFSPAGRFVGWNLFTVDPYIKTLSTQLQNGDYSQKAMFDLYNFMLQTGSHEYRHAMENISSDLTHNRNFYQEQGKILEQMVAAANPDQIEAALKTQFTGGWQNGAAVSQLVANQIT